MAEAQSTRTLRSAATGRPIRSRISRAERDDVDTLLTRWVATRDPEIRNLLIERNRGLVYAVAKNYRRSGIDVEDLASAGVFGLMRAIENFDPARGYRFSTFAVPHIRGEILGALSKEQPVSAVPRGTTVTVTSIHASMGARGSQILADQLADDDIKGPEQQAVASAASHELRELVAQLPRVERAVLTLRFGLVTGEAMHPADAARKLGIPTSQLRSIELQSLQRLHLAIRRRSQTA